MALRTKTIEFAFPTNTATVATAVRSDFAAITLYIPETNTRTFLSVVVRVGYRDTNATATTLTSPLVGVKLGAVAFSDATLGNPAANSGESQHYIFEREVTSYFTTNFGAGASQTFQVGTTATGPGRTNITAKVIITYQYEDAPGAVPIDTRIKTVRIPIESTVGALTATLANVGTNQIPALDTFLPEATKVYRNIWLEAIYNEYTVGTVNDAALGITIGGGGEQLTAVHESALGSACSGWVCFDQGAAPAWSTASAHALQARSTNITTASTFNHVGFVLHVTYEYSHSSSTRVINSIVKGLGTIDLAGATAAGDAAVVEESFYIEEPGTITLVQSGALVQYAQTAAVGPSISFGGQTARGYTDSAQLFCGETFLTQRIDSGAAQGAGITLARGKVTWNWAVFIGTTGFSPSGFDGYLLLNYTSDISAQGDGAHNHSTHFHLQGSQASGGSSTITAAQFITIAETKWWRNGLCFYSNGYGQVASPQYWFIGCENIGSEGGRLDFRELAKGFFLHDGENGWYPISFTATDEGQGEFQRFDVDPEGTRIALEGSRRWKIAVGQNTTRPLMCWLTHHSITFSVTGTISESAGGTVNVGVYRKSDGLKLGTTSRVGNGSYTATVYDNTETIFAEARESGALVGRTDDGTATGSP